MTTDHMSDDLRNRVARLVYERGMLYLRTELPAWVPGGNSLAQTEARAVASLILDAALTEMGGARVKPLEWRESYGVWRAETSFGDYMVTGKIVRLPVVSRAEMVCESTEAAKVAAQSDHEARIRAATEPAPVSVREAAVEELMLAVAAWDWAVQNEMGGAKEAERMIQALTALRAIAEGDG